MNAQKELAQVYYDTHKKIYEKEHRQATGEEIAQAILDAGFVRLDDIVVDEEKTREALQAMLIIGWERGKNNLPIDKETSLFAESRAHTIASVKGILRVRRIK